MRKIAILLPVFNGRPYLEQCLESVLRQTHADFELWIGDDGSTDGSRQLAQSLTDNRARVLTGERQGLFRNVNRLLARTQAPYVRVLCQDDVLEPECLAREIAFFEQHPDVGMTFAKGHIIDEEGQVISTGSLSDLPEIMPPLLTLQHLFYHGCFPGNLSTVAIRRGLIAPSGGFDTSYQVAADYEMWLRIGRQAPVGVIRQHLIRVRSHRGQLSVARRSGIRFIVENRRIRRQILPLLPARAQAGARRFERQRHGVLDFHYTLRCVIAGRWLAGARGVKAMGLGNWLLGAGWWLWTMNNRRYRPQAQWILPESPHLPSAAVKVLRV